MEELDEASLPKTSPVPGRADIVAKSLDGALTQLAKEKDPTKRLMLLQIAKTSAELLKLLKE
jgi:hypothetical protein